MDDTILSDIDAAIEYFSEYGHRLFFRQHAFLCNILLQSQPLMYLSDNLAALIRLDDIQQFNNILILDHFQCSLLVVQERFGGIVLDGIELYDFDGH